MPTRPKQDKPTQSPEGNSEGKFFALSSDDVFKVDRRLPAVPQICDILREMIMQLQLEPGTVISKTDIAKAFGVSSMPVREALRKLEEEGLVVIKPQSGTFVAAIDLDWAWEAQFLRIGVEVEVVKKSAETATNEDIQELEQLLRHQHLEAESDDKEGFNRDDAAFHAALYRIAGVARLWQRIGVMRVHIDRLRMMHLPIAGKMNRVLTEHGEILDAIRAGDAGRAEAAIRKHLSGTLSVVEKLRNEYPQFF